MTLKDTINKVKEIYKETKDLKNPENLDAKVVFQDTKKSLEALKESLFMQEDWDKKKQQEQYLQIQFHLHIFIVPI